MSRPGRGGGTTIRAGRESFTMVPFAAMSKPRILTTACPALEPADDRRLAPVRVRYPAPGDVRPDQSGRTDRHGDHRSGAGGGVLVVRERARAPRGVHARRLRPGAAPGRRRARPTRAAARAERARPPD